jgi:hypothetical protein
MPRNPYAFPTTSYYDEKPVGIDEGMELRDYFAAQALIGLLANPRCDAANGLLCPQSAYELADAMLREREKRP